MTAKEKFSIRKIEILLFITLYFSLIISFILGEDSTGGAFLDYQNQSKVINEFVKNIKFALLNYDQLPFTTRHSPILLILISFLIKFNFNEEIIRLIYLHLNLILPYIFYKCLKIRFKNVDKKYLLILSGIIFLSPTFRTLTIWPDSRILGLTLFTLSIFYFLKYLDSNYLKYAILNVILCALSSYVSPNFSIFAIYFTFIYLKNYGFFSSQIFKILIINLIISLPAIYYVFILKIHFFYAKATLDFPGKDLLFFNFFNQILIVSSIIFFYLIPFLITKIINFKINKNKYLIFFISLGLTLISINFFNYKISFTGGGIIFHLSNYLFDNNIFFYIFSFLSIFVIINLLINNLENAFLIICVYLGNPQTTIYHKYYDPLIFILIFTILSIEFNNKFLIKKKNTYILYIYFLIFLAINNLKHLII